jgi:hypothetical protein
MIRELLDRMLGDDFKGAIRDASNLAKSEYLGEASKIIEQSADVREREYCYLLLGRLGMNTGDPGVADFLMSRLPLEDSARLKDKVLEQLRFAEGAADCQNLIDVISQKNRRRRESAITALGHCADPKAEDTLIDLLEKENTNVMLLRTVRALARVGTKRAVPALEGMLDRISREPKYKYVILGALNTLRRVGDKDLLTRFVTELGDNRPSEIKRQCILAIDEFGTKAEIGVVIDRLTAILKNRRGGESPLDLSLMEDLDEFCAGIHFLSQFEDDRVERFFSSVSKKWARLYSYEKEYIRETVPALHLEP